MKALEPGDFARARSVVFRRRVDRALALVQEAAAKGYVGVAFSGGKDSTCLLDLVRRIQPDAPSAFYDSGCEYPSTYSLVAHYGVSVVKPAMSLAEMCRYGGYWGHPNPVDPDAEFDFFKVLVAEPSERFVAECSIGVLAMGLRAEESKGRRMLALTRQELYQVKSGLWHFCPLLSWTAGDVWAYIASRGLRYNVVYDKMAEAGISRRNQRVGLLLGVARPGIQERYAWLRRLEPAVFNRLVAEFPKIVRYT